MSAIIGLGAVVFVVVAVISLVYVGVNGVPMVRGQMTAWRIRREYHNKLADRALHILRENPHIPYQCSNWPRWPGLCGRCCAVSRAEVEVRKEADAINALLGGPR